MYLNLTEINKEVVDTFYQPNHPGVLIVRDSSIARSILSLAKKIKHKEFSLKEHSNINHGQKYYHFEPTEKLENESDLAIKSLVDLEALVRSKVLVKGGANVLEYGFTFYPKSAQGASFHIDFSYNMNCTITFFFGKTTINIATSKEGIDKKEYLIEPGDILIMRAPRNFDRNEVALRPIHAIGEVQYGFLAFEVREVNLHRKSSLKK